MKFFYAKTQDVLTNAKREIKFFQDLGGQNDLPKLLAVHVEQCQQGIGIFIVRERLDGVTLSDKIASGEPIDRWDVLKQALQWMIFLEQHNYHHGDIGTNNFIYGTDGKIYPIDYEEIRHVSIVAIRSFKVNMLFLIFMNAVLDLRVEEADLYRESRLLTNLKKHLSPKQYEQIAAIKESENFFVRMYEILFNDNENSDAKAEYDLRDLEVLSTEKLLAEISFQLKNYRDTFKQISDHMAKTEAFMSDVVQILAAQQKRIEYLENTIREQSRH